MVKFLAEKGANINAEIEYGQTVLYFAVLQNLTELTEVNLSFLQIDHCTFMLTFDSD